jgi:hypothetical protein
MNIGLNNLLPKKNGAFRAVLLILIFYERGQGGCAPLRGSGAAPHGLASHLFPPPVTDFSPPHKLQQNIPKRS